MGLREAWNALFANTGLPQGDVQFVNPFFGENFSKLSPEELYRTQPYLRIVIEFVAKNVAQLGLQQFARVSDTDRKRVTDDPLAALLKAPNPAQTGFEFLRALVSDYMLYDAAYVLVSNDPAVGWAATLIPPSWITMVTSSNAFTVDSYTVQVPNGERTVVPASDVIPFHGWNPGRPRSGSSPVETLTAILEEQINAWEYRKQIWQRGGRVGTYVTRPAGVDWSPEARKKFSRDWSAKWTGNDGATAGGTPILEDGMTLGRLGFSAREDEWADVSKLSLGTVASVYGVNPTMVGLLDNANFSNVEAFRKMLYGETLGPILAMIEDRFNAWLVPQVAVAPNSYVEFNIAEKLQGDFESQAAVLSSSVGAPWMTRNEARALQNLPALPDGDLLVTPLNVLAGGQASPLDSGTQNENAAVVPVKDARISVKSGAPDHWVDQTASVLSKFFSRQRASVLSALGAKAAADWWDTGKWDKELSDDLFKLAATAATQLGKEQAKKLGFTADDYDEARTLHFLRAVADSRAGAINAATKGQIRSALENGTEPSDVFDVAQSQRTGTGSKAFMATVAGFALVEAAKQTVGDRAVKVWETGPNPRSDHADMDGESTGLNATFSNGADWPGDPVLGAEGVANCNCGVSITF